MVKNFIGRNCPLGHADQIYTYKGHILSVGLTEKRQKATKIISIISCHQLCFNGKCIMHNCTSAVLYIIHFPLKHGKKFYWPKSSVRSC